MSVAVCIGLLRIFISKDSSIFCHRNSSVRYGGDAKKIYLVGHSAGAHLGAQFILKNALYHANTGTSISIASTPNKAEDWPSDPYSHLHSQFTKHKDLALAGRYCLSVGSK